ncbi:hypothetical protein A2715_02110 [Candidatus Woesebacteria bacterium RIFCSPHIGHO2_01_FULL_39_32]|uniref:Uncharacterized protein n=2 Tax=Candidatus Woeseibacteriota TaxID=1752722 RepID=A0A0G0PS97_9BACT|nr:MAG: hypothetical protein UT61_C0002G0027 [Candidatus Woesebacteria bacterium GW2011_GWA1_39_8]OGM03452.1 MAG: hypothetical protein A2124_02345 [Candidatus Woesebacteria bacterium GWB1_37_5]OGM23949.1 MAG: hypothetical protein A2715_02110 [Candidatus Woesebacteria bacterium RIFCSPHIGHO2_01_FULL_39_32]OGM37455.1 MAG: hypothetical protein A3F01_03345 [Candidatus Woesebacteria bacterium RIFCSPHIGHO2_12_FULL_38_11]OGM64138.1 MAG: hypothetical protein A2893_03350 [Candidatus Woesebacteria bacteri
MTNGIIKKAGKTTADIAKQIAKQVALEPIEILKSAGSQVTGREKPGEMSVMQQVMTGNGKVQEISAIEKAQEEAQTKRRIEELEQELKKLRGEREEKQQSYEQKVMGEMKQGQQEPQAETPLVEPVTRRKRGMMGPAQKKQGTKEMGKMVSG